MGWIEAVSHNDSRPTVRGEAILGTVFFGIVAGGGVLSALLFQGREPTGVGLSLLLVRMLAHNIGHAWWITLDCKRRGRAVAGWRAFAFWFGPFTVCAYLIAEYRSQAAVFIPLYLALESTALASETAAYLLLVPGPSDW